ncbi:ArsR family transcriptional regulator [Pyrococcus abyssi]|uniref:TFIIEalpha/SarR/Rpc3 HTH domain-containing protein n=1 Tax=Pyrococcus abyssi (strain GE5 / Orsay) TaxID=272844 RepID=G8ZKR4_PYRAB|nr:ArsR family transcriptional regulator [Pyrococcus abyssi]CCE70707.1 TPA: hypothetical protein PAB0838.1n [Pyrococcus abyssi GE5]
MRHVKILELLEEGEKSEEEITEKLGMPKLEVRKFLLRLAEQGKIESFQKDGKIYWKIKEKKPEEEKFKYIG